MCCVHRYMQLYHHLEHPNRITGGVLSWVIVITPAVELAAIQAVQTSALQMHIDAVILARFGIDQH